MNKLIQFRDFSKATVRTVQGVLASKNSVKLALNLDSDKETGSMVSRLGTNRVGAQAVDGATCLGIHYHRDTTGSNHKLFGVFSDGANNDIYDMLTGSKSLQDDTLGLKTRFCTFLNSTVRVNGTDACKAFNGTTWDTTLGAFDVGNMPIGSVVIEWKDRVYTAVTNIIYYSSIADPDTKTVSWVLGNGQMEVEQEDGGGDITAFEKVPGYLILFKERSMKRWDGNATYPEDLIDVGAPTQEAVCRGRGMVFFGNEDGFWATNGGYPQRISKPIQDLWDEISDYTSIATVCDEKNVKVYVGDITLNGNTYSNTCFKYNIDSQTWDVYSYYNEFTCFTWYISGTKVIVGGDKDGQALQIDTGNTDYPSIPITYSLETQDLEFGTRGRIKEISAMNVFTENITLGQIMYRKNSNRDVDWKSMSQSISSPIQEIEYKVKGNWFNFKITGISDSGQVKILGFEFPNIETKQNATE